MNLVLNIIEPKKKFRGGTFDIDNFNRKLFNEYYCFLQLFN